MQDVGRLGDEVAAELDGVGQGGQRGDRRPWRPPHQSTPTLMVAIDGFFSAFSVVR
jgi:hypothetical protein